MTPLTLSTISLHHSILFGISYNETTQTENVSKNENSNQPKYAVKVREGHGRNARYDRIGVAWENKDGSIYVKLHGKQIVDQGFTLYELASNEKSGG